MSGEAELLNRLDWAETRIAELEQENARLRRLLCICLREWGPDECNEAATDEEAMAIWARLAEEVKG